MLPHGVGDVESFATRSLKAAHQQRVGVSIRKVASVDIDRLQAEAGSSSSGGCSLSFRSTWTPAGLANRISRAKLLELVHCFRSIAAIMASLYAGLHSRTVWPCCALRLDDA
jgi:hypothetical protein